MRILLVEDDALLGDGLRAGLRQTGFAVDWVRDGPDALHALEAEPFAAVVLDLGLPAMSGLTVLRRLRARGSKIPVLILTARDAVDDRVTSLDAGGDDYVVKPVDLAELGARLRALIRRASGEAAPALRRGGLELDPAAHRVLFRGRVVELSPREFALLHELMLNAGRVLSREQLEERLYPMAAAIGANLLKPMVLALPVLGLLIWLGVRWGTRPLAVLRAQVVQRDPDNLAPLEVLDPPTEVAPLVESLNRLLARVRASIDSERRFTADAAHELRTPIAAIRAHAEVARAVTSEGERRTAVDGILAGCDRAAHAIDQLLTLARLDPGDPGGRRETCDLRDVARQVLADLAPMALAKGSEVELTDGPPVLMPGNRGLLAILMRNLVDNAVRYGPPGGSARVDVVHDGALARLVVTDQGPGIAPADRRALGRRFHRLAGSQEAGSGLGLSIVLRIGELHRATVRFQDGPGGRGLTVVVEFPGVFEPALEDASRRRTDPSL